MVERTANGDSDNFLGARLTFFERVGLFAVAAIFALIACWIFWIVQTFADGKGWGWLAVRLILHDLVFSVLFFSAASPSTLPSCPGGWTAFLQRRHASFIQQLL